MKNKFRTKKFWISLVGMVLMLLQLAGVKVDAPYVNEIVNSICAICVFVGLLDGGKTQDENEQDEGEQAEDAQDEGFEDQSFLSDKDGYSDGND